jgi:hypothetical protein
LFHIADDLSEISTIEDIIMPRKSMIAICCLLVFCGAIVPAEAASLFSLAFDQGQGGSAAYVDSFSYPITYGSMEPNRIFFDQIFTPSDIGKTVTITPETDPYFNDFTNLLTDGISEQFTIWAKPLPPGSVAVGQTFSEAWAVWGNSQDPRIDLHGYQITSYSITLDSLSIAHENGQSICSGSITFSAQGYAVPEPSTIAMLLAVALGRLLWRRRRS